jgi:TPR repeat protein
LQAQVALGELLLNGKGGPRSPEAAKALFELAAARQHASAMFARYLPRRLRNTPRPALCRRWMRPAAESGHRRA